MLGSADAEYIEGVVTAIVSGHFLVNSVGTVHTHSIGLKHVFVGFKGMKYFEEVHTGGGSTTTWSNPVAGKLAGATLVALIALVVNRTRSRRDAPQEE